MKNVAINLKCDLALKKFYPPLLSFLKRFQDSAQAGSDSRNQDYFDAEGRLDHHWVVRWLDDVGLPQYKVSSGGKTFFPCTL